MKFSVETLDPNMHLENTLAELPIRLTARILSEEPPMM
jgi:hypothetical protein